MSARSYSGKHILVVDDDPFVCETVMLLLCIDGHHVEMVGSGSQALAAFAPSRYDLIITDFFMPVMKGDELADAIKQLSPTQPVMMLTAYPEKLTRDGRSMAIDFVLGKPFHLESLRAVITQLKSVPNRDDGASQI